LSVHARTRQTRADASAVDGIPMMGRAIRPAGSAATVTTTATSSTAKVTATDGTPLLTRRWPSTMAVPWARMLLVHGVAEHSGRYERTGRLLADAGIDVTAFDLRGHGGSGGGWGDVKRWTDYFDDVATLLAGVRTDSGQTPVVLMAHSYGGLIATDYLLDGRPPPDLVVLSAPALGDGLPGWQHAVAPMLGRVLPTMALATAWGPEALSRDPAVGEQARADPGCPKKTTFRLGAFGFAAQERATAAVPERYGELGLPTLVIHGGDDPLVPPPATEPFVGVPGVTRRVYPGLRHETLNEPEGPQVVADVIAWLREAATRG
jgi:alpha-beta hydrolase superfamily lysophospholipase